MCSSHLFGLVWQLNIGRLNDGHNNGLNSGAEWGGGQPNHLLVEFIVDPPKKVLAVDEGWRIAADCWCISLFHI